MGKRELEVFVHFDRKYNVEQHINKALEHNKQVYLSMLLRPQRDKFNYYSLFYARTILDQYKYKPVITADTRIGTFYLYHVRNKIN